MIYVYVCVSMHVCMYDRQLHPGYPCTLVSIASDLPTQGRACDKWSLPDLAMS